MQRRTYYLKLAAKVTVSVGAVCTVLRRYEESDNFIERPCHCIPQKMFRREDELMEVLSKRYCFRIPTMLMQVLMITERASVCLYGQVPLRRCETIGLSGRK